MFSLLSGWAYNRILGKITKGVKYYFCYGKYLNIQSGSYVYNSQRKHINDDWKYPEKMAKHHAKAKKQRQMKIESYSTDDNLDIGSTGLSKRSKNTLIANGINTIRDAKNLYIEQGEIGFFKLCGLGRISLNEIMIFMKLKSLPHKR